jgi:hypothetical protein
MSFSFFRRKIPDSKKVVQQTIKIRKGKSGLNMDSDFTVYLPDFLGFNWRWEIPTKTYLAYKARPRHYSNAQEDYWKFVTPNDVYIDEITNALLGSKKRNLLIDEDVQRAQMALNFVQCFPYQEKKPCYVKYPIETLCENGGNCADNSVLLASMLTNMSIDCCFIRPVGHLLVGVNVPATGNYIEHRGKKYFFADAVSQEWPDPNFKHYIGEELNHDFSKADIFLKPNSR